MGLIPEPSQPVSDTGSSSNTLSNGIEVPEALPMTMPQVPSRSLLCLCHTKLLSWPSFPAANFSHKPASPWLSHPNTSSETLLASKAPGPCLGLQQPTLSPLVSNLKPAPSPRPFFCLSLSQSQSQSQSKSPSPSQNLELMSLPL